MKHESENLVRRWKRLVEQTVAGGAGGFAVPLGASPRAPMLRRVFPSMGKAKGKRG